MAPTTLRPAPLESGVWAILPTPFTPDGAVDLASVATCVAFQRARGATGLVALGVFGEAAALSADEMDAVLAAVVAAADGLPVVAGLDPLGTDEAVALAARLATAARGAGDAAPGLRAVMVKVPSPDTATTAAHLRAVAHAAGCGVVVQDYPGRSGVTIAPEALAEATLACGASVAVKAEAAPSAPTVARLVAALAAAAGGADPATAPVPVFGGLGGVGLLDELAAGAAGAMTGFAFPEGLVAALAAWRDGGFAAARDAWAPWLPLAVFEAQGPYALALRKELLRRRGALAHATVRPPAAALPEGLEALVDAHLAVAPSLTLPPAPPAPSRPAGP
jgi:4-hydroxy-tetrahydrodipicolinate synthase